MQMDQIGTGTTTANGAELYHEVRGSGTPLLLVPGLPGDAGQLEQLADRLAERYQVVTCDRRGYGARESGRCRRCAARLGPAPARRKAAQRARLG